MRRDPETIHWCVCKQLQQEVDLSFWSRSYLELAYNLAAWQFEVKKASCTHTLMEGKTLSLSFHISKRRKSSALLTTQKWKRTVWWGKAFYRLSSSIYHYFYNYLLAPDFHQQTRGKIQWLRGNPEAKTPLPTHTKHLLRKSRKLVSQVFSTIVRSFESGYLFFPLLLVIFLGKPLESLEIQHSVFSSSC